MKSSASRERILSKIRSSLAEHPLPKPHPNIDDNESVFYQSKTSLAEQYALAFTASGGRFVYCENKVDLVEKLVMLADNLDWKKIAIQEAKLISIFNEHELDLFNPDHQLEQSNAVISLCERLIAQTGSAVYTERQAYGRHESASVPVHITVAYASQLVCDFIEAQHKIDEKYKGDLPSIRSVVSGPTCTMHIESAKVIGGYGATEVYTFLVED